MKGTGPAETEGELRWDKRGRFRGLLQERLQEAEAGLLLQQGVRLHCYKTVRWFKNAAFQEY